MIKNLKEWHDNGYDGAGQMVGDVSKTPYFEDKTIDPFNRRLDRKKKTHGYWTTSTILSIAPGAKVALIPYGTKGEGLFYKGLDWCRKNGVNVINISYGGSDLSKKEYNSIKEKKQDIILTTSAGNKGEELENYAACDLFLPVGNYHNYSVKNAPLNINPIVDMDGTSFSSPIVAGLVAILCQYMGENVKLNRDDIIFLLSNGKGGVELPKFKEKLKDIEGGHWAEKEIQMLYLKGIINGYPDGTFKPERPVLRAELAKVIADLMVNFK